MQRILFLGDSITDAGRIRTLEDDGTHLGYGYAAQVAASLGCEFPGQFEFFNKGISGNKITDIYARMGRDVTALKPDYMSFMIGVNDVWHMNKGDGVRIDRFEKIYRMFIEDVLEALPNLKIMLMTPFCDSVTDEIFDGFNDEVFKRAAVIKEVADEYGFAFMNTQAIIDDIQKKAPLDYWTADGVHPTIFGHKMIADEWIRVFKKM